MKALSVRTIFSKTLASHKNSGTIRIELLRDIFKIPKIPGNHSLKTKLTFLYAIYKFAPEIRLHPNDMYKPSSVEFYLSNVKMRMDIAGGKPDIEIL